MKKLAIALFLVGALVSVSAAVYAEENAKTTTQEETVVQQKVRQFDWMQETLLHNFEITVGEKLELVNFSELSVQEKGLYVSVSTLCQRIEAVKMRIQFGLELDENNLKEILSNFDRNDLMSMMMLLQDQQ